jgi:mono/diheme cytochrome c family protein
MAGSAFRNILTATAVGLLLAVPGPNGAQAGDPALGRQKAKMCQTCHGIDGLARIPSAPHIAGESQIYIVMQLKAFRSGKRSHEIFRHPDFRDRSGISPRSIQRPNMSLWPGDRAAQPVQLVKGVQAVIALSPDPVRRHLQGLGLIWGAPVPYIASAAARSSAFGLSEVCDHLLSAGSAGGQIRLTCEPGGWATLCWQRPRLGRHPVPARPKLTSNRKTALPRPRPQGRAHS